MAYNFKSDDSFLRKLAVGAAGTNATICQLKILGFNPIELERGSTGFKIWKKIKIKRIRVPDIMCLDTGMRFESRGKTKLEISMSHSLNDPKRAWDSGMRIDDMVSIVSFEQDDKSPIKLKQISPIHFVSVRDMQIAFASEQVNITKPKGFEEGSEIRVVWTCAVANKKSIVSSIDPNRISLVPLDNSRKQTIILNRSKGKILLSPQVNIGQTVDENQIVASIVPIHTIIQCSKQVGESYYIEKLTSFNLSERYAAAKALRYRGYENAKLALKSRMEDPDEDIYVQLEAAAALAAFDESLGWEFIEDKLNSPIMEIPLETQLETVIVTSEISKYRSEKLLIEVLSDPTRDDELRAGAAWALGQFASETSANALVETFNSSPLEIKIEAARALLQIAEPNIPYLLNLFKNSEPNKRDGLSWVLARTGKFDPSEIIGGEDENLQRWVSYILGYGREKFFQDDIESICKANPKVYFAASVLWQILESWITDLKEY